MAVPAGTVASNNNNNKEAGDAAKQPTAAGAASAGAAGSNANNALLSMSITDPKTDAISSINSSPVSVPSMGSSGTISPVDAGSPRENHNTKGAGGGSAAGLGTMGGQPFLPPPAQTVSYSRRTSVAMGTENTGAAAAATKYAQNSPPATAAAALAAGAGSTSNQNPSHNTPPSLEADWTLADGGASPPKFPSPTHAGAAGSGALSAKTTVNATGSAAAHVPVKGKGAAGSPILGGFVGVKLTGTTDAGGNLSASQIQFTDGHGDPNSNPHSARRGSTDSYDHVDGSDGKTAPAPLRASSGNASATAATDHHTDDPQAAGAETASTGSTADLRDIDSTHASPGQSPKAPSTGRSILTTAHPVPTINLAAAAAAASGILGSTGTNANVPVTATAASSTVGASAAGDAKAAADSSVATTLSDQEAEECWTHIQCLSQDLQQAGVELLQYQRSKDPNLNVANYKARKVANLEDSIGINLIRLTPEKIEALWKRSAASLQTNEHIPIDKDKLSALRAAAEAQKVKAEAEARQKDLTRKTRKAATKRNDEDKKRDAEAAAKKLSDDKKQYEEELERVKRERDSKVQEATTLGQIVQNLTSELSATKQTVTTIRASQTSTDEAKKNLEAEKKRLEAELQAQVLAAKAHESEAARYKLDADKLTAAVSVLNTEKITLVAAQAELEKQRATMEQQLKQREAKVSEISAHLKQVQEAHQSITVAHQQACSDRDAKALILAQKQTELQRQQAELQKKEDELRSKDASLTKESSESAAAKASIALLQSEVNKVKAEREALAQLVSNHSNTLAERLAEVNKLSYELGTVRKVSDQQASELTLQTAQIKIQATLLLQKEHEIQTKAAEAAAAAKRNAEAIAAATKAATTAQAQATTAFQDLVL